MLFIYSHVNVLGSYLSESIVISMNSIILKLQYSSHFLSF